MKKLLAPNGNTSNLNDKQYKLVRTSAFKKWFGNWEVLAEAKTLSNDIKGVYKLVALNDVEQFLFEISQQANNSKSERSGAIETVGKRIVELALELFPNSKVGDEFIPVVSKVVDDNGEPLILWHGTKKEFTVFGKDKVKGIDLLQNYLHRKNTNYFHIHKKYAKTFGSKYGGFEKPYFLNIKKIKLIDNETIEDIGYWKYIYDDYVNLGFDGVYSEDGQYATLLNPNQIKLADGSNTTFDENNDDIRFNNGGNVLLAPNGKPSKLNEEQYKLVRTSAFKKWFGDWENNLENSSKVIDKETKEPMVCYHGSYDYGFTIFNKKYRGNVTGAKSSKKGFFFYDKKKDSEKFSKMSASGGVYEVFLNIKYPNIKNYNSENVDADKELLKLINSFEFDGAIALNIKDGFDIGNQYIVFEPNQIKLADGSNTTFDSNNDDIRYKRGGRTIAQTPAPKKERIYGSNTNKEKSSESNTSAKQIVFNDNTLKSIKNKVDKHNEENPDKLITLSSAKAVVRRGMGAYSLSHRPTIKGGKPNSRVAWGLARLNAFIYKVKNGVSKSGKYTQDDDLINDLNIKYNIGGDISDASYENVKKDKLNYLDVLSNIWSNFNIKF